MSKSQRVMRCRLILEESDLDINHINGEDNIVVHDMSRLSSTNQDKDDQHTGTLGPLSKTLAELEQLVLEEDEGFHST